MGLRPNSLPESAHWLNGLRWVRIADKRTIFRMSYHVTVRCAGQFARQRPHIAQAASPVGFQIRSRGQRAQPADVR